MLTASQSQSTSSQRRAGSSPDAGLAARRARIIVLLGGALIVAIWYALVTGAVPISLAALFEDSVTGEFQRTVFAEIRSPRIVLAAFVGSSLALAGASLQGLLRNPLADPGLIGVSSGAALGAIAMIVLGGALEMPDWLEPYVLPLAAVAGGGLVTVFHLSLRAALRPVQHRHDPAPWHRRERPGRGWDRRVPVPER